MEPRTHTDIKSIDPTALNTIDEVDAALATVDHAIAAMRAQQDTATQGSSIKLAELDPKTRSWYVKIQVATRFAKGTKMALERRREAIFECHDVLVAELTKLIGEDRVEAIRAKHMERKQK